MLLGVQQRREDFSISMIDPDGEVTQLYEGVLGRIVVADIGEFPAGFDSVLPTFLGTECEMVCVVE